MFVVSNHPNRRNTLSPVLVGLAHCGEYPSIIQEVDEQEWS